MHFEANYYKGYGGYKGTIMPTPTPTPRTPTPLPWGVTPTPAIHYIYSIDSGLAPRRFLQESIFLGVRMSGTPPVL